MVFFLEISLLFIKLFAAIIIQLFLSDNFLLKIILLLVCYYGLMKMIKRKYNPIKEYFPDHYKMISIQDKMYNIFILAFCSSIFTLGLLFLRFQTKERSVDLKNYMDTLYVLLCNASLYSIILNLFLLGFLVGLYWVIIASVGRYYKYHLIKRHIYLSHGKSITFYDNFCIYVYKFSVDNFWLKSYLIVEILSRFFNFKKIIIIMLAHNNRLRLLKSYFSAYRSNQFLDTSFKRILNDLRYYIHHLICVIALGYDLLYNNITITHVFALLPYVFMYEIWIRISKFYNYRHPANDNLLYELLYVPTTFDKESNIIYTSSGELMLEDFQDIVFNYLFPGLVNKEIKDLYEPHYLRQLRDDLLRKCWNILIKMHIIQEKIIGLTKIDYIILAEIIFLAIILK
jgi:hypothetical protein